MIKQLNAIQTLSPGLIGYLTQNIIPLTLTRSEYLLRPGQIAAPICFVQAGLLRGYHNNRTREVTTAFWKGNDWAITVGNFFSERRGTEYMQAMEETTVYPISDTQLQGICDRFPEFNFHLLILVLRNHRRSLQLLDALRGERSRERYNWLIKQYPDLAQRIPAKYLASYIGITEVMLSMVKNGKK